VSVGEMGNKGQVFFDVDVLSLSFDAKCIGGKRKKKIIY